MLQRGVVLAVFLCTALSSFASDRPQACFSGKVVDSYGASVADVTITASRHEQGGSQNAVSDALGQFEICGLRPGAYRVLAHQSEFQDGIFYKVLAPEENAPFNISLRRKSTVRATDRQPAELELEDGRAAGEVGTVDEFRAAVNVSSAQEIPDALLRSNENLLHGQAYGFRGSAPINLPDMTLRNELPISEFGAALGGTIHHDRTAYFVSFDQFGTSQEKLLSFLTTVQAQTGSNALPIETNPASFSALAARTDHQFSERDSAYLQFNRDDLHSYALKPNENAVPASLATDLRVTQQTASAGNTIAISPDTLNTTSAQVTSTDLQLPAGVPAMGVQSGLPTLRRNRVFEAADNIYRQAGGQGLRTGGDFIYNQMAVSFLENRPSAGNSFFSQSSRDADLYVLSEKRVLPNLLLSSGIRYDIQTLRGFKTDMNNLAPEVGFAFAPSPRTLIRAGGGIYYDQIPLPSIAGPSEPGGIANLQNSGRFVSRNGLAADQLGGFTTRNPSLQNSYAEQMNVQVEQQLGAKSVLSAQSQYVRGVQLPLPVFTPAALCTSPRACDSGNVFWGQQMGTGADSSYMGTSVAFTQQPARWGNYKVSYTYATVQGSGTGANTSLINDEMRRVSFIGVLHTSLNPGSDLWQHLANGFVLSGMSDYTNRNEFAGFNFVDFNSRLSKTLAWGKSYHLDALAETVNTWQRANAAFARSVAQMGDSAASIFSTYQRVASFQNPNGGQFGLRLTF